MKTESEILVSKPIEICGIVLTETAITTIEKLQEENNSMLNYLETSMDHVIAYIADFDTPPNVCEQIEIMKRITSVTTFLKNLKKP